MIIKISITLHITKYVYFTICFQYYNITFFKKKKNYKNRQDFFHALEEYCRHSECATRKRKIILLIVNEMPGIVYRILEIRNRTLGIVNGILGIVNRILGIGNRILEMVNGIWKIVTRNSE